MQWQRFFDPFGLGEQAGLYGGQPNPADKAMPYLNEAQKQYEPYQRQGQEAGGQLYPEYANMMKDPAAFLEQMMKGYQPSSDYQNKFNAMSQAAGNTAAAGGMRGSLNDIQEQAGLSQSLMGKDMQQWLQNALGIKSAGMEGLEGFNKRGFESTSDIANILNSKGGLSYLGQSNQNKTQQDQMKGLMEMFMKILPMMM